MGINIADPDAQANILAGRRNREAVAAALRPTDATKSDSNDERRRDADIDADVEISDPDSEIEFSSTSSAAANEMVDHGVPGGLPSARRMGDSYQIMSENDANRRGGMEEALLTVSMIHDAEIMNMFLPISVAAVVPRAAVSFAEWASWF